MRTIKACLPHDKADTVFSAVVSVYGIRYKRHCTESDMDVL